jgi:fructose-1,6-bisphosphatase/inositol monophosphatase family enzyme
MFLGAGAVGQAGDGRYSVIVACGLPKSTSDESKTMQNLDLDALGAILRDAAHVEIMPRWRRLTPEMIRSKSNPSDLVTEADEAAEPLIRVGVARLMPDAVFIGEESVAADPALLDQVATADLVVIVDPVDGTGNFAAGLPLFAVMAAVVRKGETIGGIIYDPFADDFVMAERGGGTFVKRPDGTAERVHAAGPSPLAEMLGAASMAYLPREQRAAIYPNLAKLRIATSYRCAGHEYRIFASGHLDFLFHSKLMPWDHLPGTLLASEAGAYVARLDGSPYRPGQLDGNLLIAADPDSWHLLHREVFTL